MTEINVNLYESSPEIKVDITATGPQGPQGPKGEKGETGGVSTEELKKAIDSALEETIEDTVQVSTEERIPLWTPELAEVGQMLRVKQKNDDGSVILETVRIPSELVSDIQIDGQSIVKDGVAEIPFGSNTQYGIVKSVFSKGIGISNGGIIEFNNGGNVKIDERSNNYAVLNGNIDYAVKAAMCDGKGAAWTTDEQAAARERMGIGEWELIADVTLEEDVNSYKIQTQYGYKQIKVFLDNVEDGTNGSFYSYGIVKRVNGNYQGAITITYGDLSTRYRYGYIGMECINENVIAVTENSVKSSKDAIYGIYNFPCFKQSWYYSDKLYGIAFTPVKEADILKTGTNIQVYGVRA